MERGNENLFFLCETEINGAKKKTGIIQQYGQAFPKNGGFFDRVPVFFSCRDYLSRQVP